MLQNPVLFLSRFDKTDCESVFSHGVSYFFNFTTVGSGRKVLSVIHHGVDFLHFS